MQKLTAEELENLDYQMKCDYIFTNGVIKCAASNTRIDTKEVMYFYRIALDGKMYTLTKCWNEWL